MSLPGHAVAELLRTVTEKGKSIQLRVGGSSMHPIIRDQDVVTVAPLNGVSPGFGDVVSFERPNTKKLTIHRIIQKKQRRYLVKGDNSIKADGFVSLPDIIGRVTRIERNDHKVHFGLGPERTIIALLSRRTALYSFLYPILKRFRPLIKRK